FHLRSYRQHFRCVFSIGAPEFRSKRKVPILVPVLSVAIEQRHGVESDEFPIALARNHGVYFEVLSIFVIETRKQLSSEIGDFFGSRPREASFLRQLLQSLRS